MDHLPFTGCGFTLEKVKSLMCIQMCIRCRGSDKIIGICHPWNENGLNMIVWGKLMCFAQTCA